ncbi:MAG: hypothetical protein ACM3MI_08800 [Clostridiales bacterium]
MKSRNKKIASLFMAFLMVLAFQACNKKENQQPIPPVISQDSAKALDRQLLSDKVKKQLGDSALIIEPGKFQSDSTVSGVVAGTETNTKNLWGIKFIYFKSQNGTLQKDFESPLLKGSFKDCMVRKIKLADSNYEMIYYDSQDYFIGSGGGEVFSYIVDMNTKKVYSAHFFTVPQKPVSLFISPNVDKMEIREIFLKHFKKDYPDLKVVSKDYNLEDIF